MVKELATVESELHVKRELHELVRIGSMEVD